jgi:hypothetical protein
MKGLLKAIQSMSNESEGCLKEVRKGVPKNHHDEIKSILISTTLDVIVSKLRAYGFKVEREIAWGEISNIKISWPTVARK